MTTIYALASGALPCAIAVLRISGPSAHRMLAILTRGELPPSRTLVRRDLYASAIGGLLDRAMVVRFDRPATATGEDVVELHVHGGAAVVEAVSAALNSAGAVLARPGEFTRRAFDNGRLSLAEVEALGDLIAAETDTQRLAAHAQTNVGREIVRWHATVRSLRAEYEAVLDFADIEEVADVPASCAVDLAYLEAELMAAIADGRRGRGLRDGVTIAITGPVNAGKSSLFNRLAQRDAAIVASSPGTTRDCIEARITLAGLPAILIDTAGTRETVDAVELEGIQRAQRCADASDIVVALDAVPDDGTIAVRSKSDLRGIAGWHDGVLHVSAQTGAGIDLLVTAIETRIFERHRPHESPIFTHARQLALLEQAHAAVQKTCAASDPILAAEELRRAGAALDGIARADGDVLDAIFSRFCIGK